MHFYIIVLCKNRYILNYCKHLTFQIDGSLIKSLKASHIILSRKRGDILLLGSLERVSCNS